MVMSRYEAIQNLSDEDFRRLTGVMHGTFMKMAEILSVGHAQKKRRGGRPNKLCIEDMLLMALEYLREYRTYFHIGQSYGLSESNAYQTVKWVEGTLIKDGAFSLPGRKALLESDAEFDVILVDATESPVERPKRGSGNGIRGRKSVTR
jgi:hypothetical protein